MYLQRLFYENVGPLEKIDIYLGFTDKGLPKPLVLVGKNGAGKSILLSNIVDFFHEFASMGFKNITMGDSVSHEYYKILGGNQISIGKKYMVSYISLFDGKDKLGFYVKSGEINVVNYGKDNNIDIKSYGTTDENYKRLFMNEVILQSDRNKIQKILRNNVVCYFGDNRYSNPRWLGSKYDTSNHIIEKKLFGNILPVSFMGINSVETIKSWIFDVVVDAKAQIALSNSGNGVNISLIDDIGSVFQYNIVKENLDKILSVVLDREVQFTFGQRHRYDNRLFIVDRQTKKIVVPSFNDLSTGQQILFSTFAYIVKFADAFSLDKSLKLSDVQGIVVIDEIELHMHPSVISNVIPKLMKLFPKIQFVITSHSPLFVLGLEKEYGREGFDLYELPQGYKIDAEEFSEFRTTFNSYCNSDEIKKLIQNEINKALINSVSKTKPLIITEGKTDWMHMKAALVSLKEQQKYGNVLDDLEIEFFEYNNLNMGSELKKMCESFSKVPQERKIIFVADRDVPNDIKALTNNGNVRNWGNNVYSFCIPQVPYRPENICIEHYYSDEEIMTIDKNGRRLYIGKEFDSFGRGIFTADGKLYSGGNRSDVPGTIKIIDGDIKNRVVSLNEPGNNFNYALSKTDFAQNVLHRKNCFDKFNFDYFIWIFEIFKQITDGVFDK